MNPLFFLDSYRNRIETKLISSLDALGEPSRLREACIYACLNGGKRLRPILVLLIGEALGKERDLMPAALSVEYFHTASLITDDLPCMDDDDFRRGKPSLHRAYGESTAILASYTLIAAGYGAIHEMSESLKEEEPRRDAIAMICLEEVSRSAGLRGATYGQFLDLSPPDGSEKTIRTIIQCKTSTLFEIAFTLGWLFGGGSESRLNKIKECAAHLGLAFQVADDLQDFAQDRKEMSLNFARTNGIENAHALFQQELELFINCLQSLDLWTKPFCQICDSLQESLKCIRKGGIPVLRDR